MKSLKCSVTPKGCRFLAKAVAPMVLMSSPVVFGQTFTLATFNNGGSGLTLTSGTNNSTGVALNSNELVDVNGVATFANGPTSTLISMALETVGSSNTVSVGALAYDVAIPVGKSIAFDADSSSSGTFTAGTLSLGGGSLDIGQALPSGASTSANDLITITNNVGGLVDLGQTNYGTLDINVPTAGGNFNIASSSTLEIGTFSILNGSGRINVTGGGTLEVTGSQTSAFTGGYTITGSTLEVNSAGSFSFGATDTTTLANGTIILDKTGLLLGSSHPLSLTNGGGTINTVTGTTLFEESVSGTGGIIKTGAGTLALAAKFNGITNTFTGPISINQGTLQISSTVDVQTSSGITINGGTLAYSGYSSSYATAVPTNVGISLLSSTSDIDVGPVVLGGAGTLTTLTIGGSLTGTGSLLKTGTGTLILTGTSTFSGSTTVAGGTLSITGVTQLGALPAVPTGNIFLSGGALQFTENTTSTPFNANRTVVIGTATSGATGTLSVSTTHTVVFNGAFVDSAGNFGTQPGGVGMLVKANTGTLLLNSSSSAYSGGTRVYGGLLITGNTAGSATGSGPVAVGDGATNAGSFGGSGIVGGAVTISSNGTLAPGVFGGTSVAIYSPGTLTIAGQNLTLSAGSTYVEKLGATTNDQVMVNGGGNIIFGDGSSATTLNLSLVDAGVGGTPAAGTQYIIAEAPTGSIINFANLTTNITSASNTLDPTQFSVSLDPTGTELLLSVPEPVSSALILFASTSLLRRRRRVLVEEVSC